MRIPIILSLIAASVPAFAASDDYAKRLEEIVAKDAAGITSADLPELKSSCATVRQREKENAEEAKASGGSYIRPVALAVCDKIGA
jgi:hypothetical protein